MKKSIALALSCLLSVSLAQASESNFEYKYTKSTKITLGMAGAGVGIFSAGLVTNHFQGKDGGLLVTAIGFYVGATGAIAFPIATLTNGLKEVDRENFVKEYNKIYNLSKAIKATGIIPANSNYQSIVAGFTCSDCNNPVETIKEFSNIFVKVDALAKSIVSHEDFNLKKADNEIDNASATMKLKSLLGANLNDANFKYIKSVLAMAIVKHSIK